LHLGLAEPAARELVRTMELDLGASTLRNDGGVDFLERGHSKEALIDFDLAIALDPRNELAQHNRGRALFDLGRIEEALAAHDRAIALREAFPEAHHYRGLALHALGRRAEAIAAFERALDLDPSNADARRCLAALH
jgi:tetratricopeptide (TPR) repeat protein